MTYYGKKQNELTELEKNLLHIDQLLVSSMLMNLRGESLISGNPNYDMTSGTHEDISDKLFWRFECIKKILGNDNLDMESINDTPYNLQDFCIQFSEVMYGKPIDVLYHYHQKFVTEMSEELELEHN